MPLKPNLKSKNISNCLWKRIWPTITLLKFKGGWNTLLTFRLNITSWVFFDGSGLKLISIDIPNCLFYLNTPFESICDKLTSLITENGDV